MNLSTKTSKSQIQTIQEYTKQLSNILGVSDIKLVEAKYKVSGKTIIIKPKADHKK